jgi:DNA repair exonuclease SbcCD ATPase subunit
LALQVRDHQETAEHLAALQQRRDQLEALATRLETLLDAARVLRAEGASIPAARELQAAKQAALDLKVRYERDPQSVRRAQPAALEFPLQSVEDALRRSWSEMAAPKPDAVALAQLLARFPQFRGAQTEISQLCEELKKAATALPTCTGEMTRVSTLKQTLKDRIEALEDDGMDGAAQRFLRRSASGVPLEQLLSEPNVLEFLRAHGLLSALTVSFRPNGRMS